MKTCLVDLKTSEVKRHLRMSLKMYQMSIKPKMGILLMILWLMTMMRLQYIQMEELSLMNIATKLAMIITMTNFSRMTLYLAMKKSNIQQYK